MIKNLKILNDYQEQKNTEYSIINGRWHMNNKSFNELSINEKSALAERIKTF
jgi:hypothetical protein